MSFNIYEELVSMAQFLKIYLKAIIDVFGGGAAAIPGVLDRDLSGQKGRIIRAKEPFHNT